jgi:hypothetical protein
MQLARLKQKKVTIRKIKDKFHNNEKLISLPFVCSIKNASKFIQTLGEIPINPNTRTASLDISNKYTIYRIEWTTFIIDYIWLIPIHNKGVGYAHHHSKAKLFLPKLETFLTK